VGTTGRKIYEGAKSVKLFGEEISINAEISFLPGKSGHADKAGLLKWINAFETKPDMVFVNHGDDDSCKAYATCLHDDYGFTVSAPYSGAVFDLAAGDYTAAPEGIPIRKRQTSSAKAQATYDGLAAAVKRLSELAHACKSIPNKELIKLTRDINELYSKWESWTKRK